MHQVFAVREHDVLARPDLLAWIKTGILFDCAIFQQINQKPIKKVSALVLTGSFSNAREQGFDLSLRPLALASLFRRLCLLDNQYRKGAGLNR